MTPEQAPNPNLVWAQTFVGALVQGGLHLLCLAPGSRSTPLALAFAAAAEVEIVTHLDERSAAFFALGRALADEAPTAVLCTSGTAAANFFPAVIEARQSGVPLLVLTADRPPELRHSGANQTIDQIKLFGDQVLWSVDVALPETAPPPVALRNLQTLAARALDRAAGPPAGPVHLNFPFRKPLEPAPGAPLALPVTTSTTIARGRPHPPAAQLDALAAAIAAHPRGLVVCGPRCPGGDFPAAAAALAARAGYPLLADAVSGVRFGPHVAEAPTLSGGYDTFLAAEGWPAPELILRFGQVPTSRALNDYLERAPDAPRWHVAGDGAWADDSHRLDALLVADPALTCRALLDRLPARPAAGWSERFSAAEEATWAALDAALDGPFFDGTAVADLITALPPGSDFFAGNSLPIRHVDQFGRPRPIPVAARANRGASGIDGVVSTALGAGSAASGGRPVLLIGDISFYHDMNGLLALRRLPRPATIVLLNNDGGHIFRRLPIAAHEPPFTELFLTPHGLDFTHVAALYDLDHYRPAGRPATQAALVTALAAPRSNLVEVRTDGADDLTRRREVMAAVTRRVAEVVAT